MRGCSNSGIFGATLLMRDVVTSSSSSCAFSSGRLFPGATSGRKHHVYYANRRSHHVLEWKEDIVDGRSTVEDKHLFNADLFSTTKCWGRRPLLIRNAFDHKLLLNDNVLLDDIEDNVEFEWPSWKDVVEIASDDDAESRVISHVPGDYTTFDVRWGPLSNRDVDEWVTKETNANSNQQRDKTRKETLVVNDIDRFYPPLSDWIHSQFDFIPNWRLDDGQISLAEYNGGIGPHVDNYDVFLIQMNGSRTWQVGKRKIDAMEEFDRLIDDIDVRILSDWKDNQEAEVEEWILNPGDMLYLPPRVPHCGIALSDGCMTLSVGCRAPSVSDLVSRLAERMSTSLEETVVMRYTDDDLLDNGSCRDNASLITVKAKEDAKNLVLNALTTMLNDDSAWDEFFGRYITEPKRLRTNYPIPLNDCDDDVLSVEDVLRGNGALFHAEGICFSHSIITCDEDAVDASTSKTRLFVNGKMWQCDSMSSGQLYVTIANHRMLDGPTLLKALGDNKKEEAVKFLEELVSIGVLYTSEE